MDDALLVTGPSGDRPEPATRRTPMPKPTSSKDPAPEEGTPPTDEGVVPGEDVVLEPQKSGPRPTGGFIRPV